MMESARKTKEDLIELLEKIGYTLSKPVKIYILGGAALTLRDIKESTIDVDIIVENEDNYNVLVDALYRLGFYRESELRYKNPALDEHIDIDAGKFIKLRFYSEFKKDVEFLGSYGNLTAFLLSNESIIIYKSITERRKDVEDIMSILRRANVNWNKLISIAASITRKELERKREKGIVAIYEVFYALQGIREKDPSLIPNNIFKRIENYAMKYYSKWKEYISQQSTQKSMQKIQDTSI